MKPNNYNAFTLMELMLVVIIVGIIVGFAIPNYHNSVERAYFRTARTHLISIYAANQAYRAEHGDFWPTANDQDVDSINLNLNLHIIEDGLIYECDGTTGTAFTCFADRHSAPADPILYTLRVTQASEIPTCAGGTEGCPY